jgi:hypothetical protein
MNKDEIIKFNELFNESKFLFNFDIENRILNIIQRHMDKFNLFNQVNRT